MKIFADFKQIYTDTIHENPPSAVVVEPPARRSPLLTRLAGGSPRRIRVNRLLTKKIFIPVPLKFQKTLKRSRIGISYFMLAALLLLDFFGPLTYIKLSRPQNVEAAWFNDAWGFRKPVEITNGSGGVLTDFQVSFTIDTTDATKFQTTCNDIRVTDTNGKLLPHWFEGPCGNASSKIWVKAPTLPTNGITLYIYYGNPTANSTSSTSKTFIREVNGIRGAWSLEETSSPSIDSSGNNNSGTWQGNTTYSSSGKFGNAASFDGLDDSIRMAESSSLTITGQALSLSAWIFPNTGSNGPFIHKGSRYTFYRTSSRTMSYADSVQYSYASNGYYGDTPNSQWSYVVVTFDGINRRIYVNNSLVATINKPGSLTDTNWGFLLGCYDDSGTGGASCSDTNSFNGLIDEVRIYNSVLSPDEISDYYGSNGNNYGYVTSNYSGKELIRKYAATQPSSTTGTEQSGTGPVAYWKFDEGQGGTTNDSGIGRNNGTITGATWQTEDQCLSGKCLNFNGSGTYVTAADATVDTSGAHTYSVWAKAYTIPADRVIMGDWGGSNSGTMFYSRTADNVCAYVSASEYSCTTPSLNEWHHYVLADNNTNVSFYVDGKLIGTTNSTTSDGGSFYVGTYAARAGSSWNGLIDEVKVYNYARTPAQIASDYTAGKAGQSSVKGVSASIGSKSAGISLSQGLVGYWKMDEATWSGVAVEVIDSSGNGNNGVAAGPSNDKPYTLGGKFGNGGKFDGVNDYVYTTSLASQTSGTYAFWVKPSSIDTQMGWLETNSNFDIFQWDTGSGIVYFRPGNSGNQQSYSISNWTANTWHHVAMTWNNTTFQGFLDGIQVVSGTTNGTFSGVVNIGNVDGSFFLNGNIDDVRVYNRALSPSEVSQLYNWAPGPIGYFDFEDGQGTTITNRGSTPSGTLINGTWNGTGTSRWGQGKFGKGGNFNAANNDYVNITPTGILNLTSSDNFTYEAWFKKGVSSNLLGIISNLDRPSSDYIGLGVGIQGTSLNAYIGDGAGNYTAFSNTWANDANWHHVAYTYLNGTSTMYLDGTKLPTGSTTPIVQNNTPIMIGKWATFYSEYYFQGQIDDVKIYNYARSAKQITEDMNGGHPAGGSPVGSQRLYWKFDEGQGLTAYDISPQRNTGTLQCSYWTYGDCTNPVWTNEGKFGKGIYFNGAGVFPNPGVRANRVRGTSINLSSTVGSKMTWSLWVKPESSQPGSGWLIRNGYSTDENYGINLGGISNGNFIVQMTGYDGGSFRTISTTGYYVPANQWSQLTVIYSQGEWMKVYVNGAFKEQVTWAYGATVQSTSHFNLGAHGGSAVQWYNGSIDEVKVYDGELTASEIALDFNRGSSLVMGSMSDTSSLSGGSVASNSASAEYCIPGDSSTCRPPVGRWDFEEGKDNTCSGGTNDVCDISGNGNDGAWNGTGTQHFVQGKNGKAVNLNETTSDYINIAGPAASLQITGDITIESWVKTSASGDWQIIADDLGGSPYTSWCQWIDPSGKIAWYDNATWRLSATSINNGLWHHVVTVVSSNNLSYYIDGVKDANTYNSVAALAATSDAKTFGRRADAADNYFLTGQIDQVKIYNYARTPAQIAWDYNRGKPIAWYKFDECQGGTANDASGFANNGTINIGATVPQTVLGTCTTPTDGTGAWYNGINGKYSSAMSFDGVDDNTIITDPSSGILDFGTGSFTISSWVKPNSGLSNFYEVIGKKTTYNGSNIGWQVWLDYRSTPIMSLRINDGSTTNDLTPGPSSNLSALFNGNSWRHVVWVVNVGNNVTFYVDGVSYGSPSISGMTGTISNSVDLDIGGKNNYYFPGLLDDVKIFNYALTTQQVKLLYNENSSVRYGPSSGNP